MIKTFNYKITKSDYLNAQKEFTKKGILRTFLIMFFTASFVFGMASDLDLGLWYMYFILLIITGFLSLICLPIYQKFSLSRSYEKYTQFKKEHIVRIEEDKVFFKSENGESSYSYGEFLKIKSIEESILLFFGPKIFLILPKRVLDQESISLLEKKAKEIKS